MPTGETSTNHFAGNRGITTECSDQKGILQWRAHFSKALFVISHHILIALTFSYFRHKSALTKMVNHVMAITVSNMK
jgi:hypothetical protein